MEGGFIVFFLILLHLVINHNITSYLIANKQMNFFYKHRKSTIPKFKDRFHSTGSVHPCINVLSFLSGAIIFSVVRKYAL